MLEAMQGMGFVLLAGLICEVGVAGPDFEHLIRIEGHLLDGYGDPIEGARITLHSKNSDRTIAVFQSKEGGLFQLWYRTAVVSVPYVLEFVAPGFKPLTALFPLDDGEDYAMQAVDDEDTESVRRHEIADTTPCELIWEPSRFNGKMVTLSGRIDIGSEKFMLDTSSCGWQNINAVWLEYGRGPKRQPTAWCCGDLSPRDPLRVVGDREFRKFRAILEFEVDSPMDYRVTANLTGRFDVVETVTCRDLRHQCPKAGGFGHLGLSASRIVISSVSEVVAEK